MRSRGVRLLYGTPQRGTAGSFSAAGHRSRDPQFQPVALADLDRRLVALRDRLGDSPKS